jgi:arginine deiminase
MSRLANAAAFGGAGWSPRTMTLREELGSTWARCGVDSEWRPLRAVLLHRPGAELAVADPDAAQMLERPDPGRAAAQHDAVAGAYRAAGVAVHYVDPVEAQPNLVFCADLFFMTPAGAIVGRPASTVRAGEERWVARRLADIGVPILRTIGGHGLFEGADALWLDRETVLVGRGMRTNDDGARQVAATLAEQGVATVCTDLPHGAMHLMGQLRILAPDLAVVRRGRLPEAALATLRGCGYDVHVLPEVEELDAGHAHNVVVLGPRSVLMPAGNPRTRDFLESLGVSCGELPVDELVKAAGAIGCITGVLERDPASGPAG